MTTKPISTSLFDPDILKQAAIDAFLKLTPKQQWKNPVMFVVYLGSMLTTVLWFQALGGHGEEPAGFILNVALWLWFTVLFANFAEAVAEGRSKAQAAFLRSAKRDIAAKKLDEPRYGANFSKVAGSTLRKGDVVLIETGDFVPGDGEVIEGVASVDESAITGESAPVIRESGGDFNSVTGGTRVLSDWLVVRISVNPGEAFLDRMISMVESAKRQKTPNEIALTILLVALTLVFLFATVTLLPFSLYSVETAKAGNPISITVLVALLVCLIPTTIGGLLSAIGVAGIGRMMQKNVIATSGRAVEAAGDVNVLLLDKTGTITLGNRQASAFYPVKGTTPQQLADAAQLASLADETPEGRSIVILAKQKFGIRERDVATLGATFVQFSAQTRMSGVNLAGRHRFRGRPASRIFSVTSRVADRQSTLIPATSPSPSVTSPPKTCCTVTSRSGTTSKGSARRCWARCSPRHSCPSRCSSPCRADSCGFTCPSSSSRVFRHISWPVACRSPRSSLRSPVFSSRSMERTPGWATPCSTRSPFCQCSYSASR